MAIPIYSTITLITELFITAAVLYIFYSGYNKNKFPVVLAVIAVGYETLLNISYMVYRALTHSESSSVESTFEIALAIFHGTLSLVMFVTLVIFLFLAWKNYKNGINFFEKHKLASVTFILLWLSSVVSGILFYIIEYLV